MKKVSTVIIILLLVFPLFAEVKLFLKPTIHTAGEDLYIEDIARITGTSDDILDMGRVRVRSSFLEDGLIQKKEIEKLLSGFDDKIRVYGTAVRVLPETEENLPDTSKGIAKGDIVDIQIRRKGVLIETTGEAMVDAQSGQIVTVRVKGTRRLRGVLSEAKIVEVGE